MTAPRERVRQLMALAAGVATPVEEARSAAMLAVRLIEREGLLEGRSDNFFARATPAPHCAGCRCFSNVPRTEEQARRDAFWGDVLHEPESEEQKRYREGWERIWGPSR